MKPFKKTFYSLFNSISSYISFCKYHINCKKFDFYVCNCPQSLIFKRVIFIKNSELKYYITDSKQSTKPLRGIPFFSNSFIMTGDWDLNKRQILPYYYNESIKFATSFRSTYQIFKHNIPYTQCDEYKCKLLGLNGYEQSTSSDLDIKYKKLHDIYKSIKHRGYLPQKDLTSFFSFFDHTTLKDEIRIAIDRKGSFLKIAESGNHRLAISKILNIKSIPVYVQGVHATWAINCYRKHGKHMLHAINTELDTINEDI